MRYVPKKYMKKAIKFVLSRGAAGLLLDPGLGKTGIMLAAFRVLVQAELATRWLVVAPLRGAYETWPEEAKKWDEFRELDLAVLHGPRKGELLRRRGAQLDVINPEGLGWLLQELKGQRWPYDGLIVDESTKFKNARAKRFGALRPKLKKFLRRYILTGSPAANGLLGIFGQTYLLDYGGSLGESFTNFRNSYFEKVSYGSFKWKPREHAEAAIYKKLKPLCLRMSAEDYLELPPLRGAIGRDPDGPLITYVRLDPKVEKLYLQMEEELWAELDDPRRSLVLASNSGTAYGKCRQLANGGIFLSDLKGKFRHVHEAKTEAVVDLVEQLQGQPCLVAYEYAHDLVRLQRGLKKALGEAVPHIGGGVSPGRVKDLRLAWNCGSLPVLLGQPQSMMHSLNMQGPDDVEHTAVVWHSPTPDLEAYEQFYKRVWRQGRRGRVSVHHVVARGTVDHAILRALERKDRGQRALFDALLDYRSSKGRAAAPRSSTRRGR